VCIVPRMESRVVCTVCQMASCMRLPRDWIWKFSNKASEQHTTSLCCSLTLSQSTKQLLTLPTVGLCMTATSTRRMHSMQLPTADRSSHPVRRVMLHADALKAVVAAAKPGTRIVELCEKGDAAINQ
jgi:hypothetical protein